MDRRIVVLIVPPIDELDLVGPVEVLGTANRVLRGKRTRYVVEVVTAGKDRRVEGANGLLLLAHRHYRDVVGRPDSVLVISGTSTRGLRDRALLGWLNRLATTARRVGSVCVSAFLLAEAGLLDGRRATVHWRYAQEFARRYPRVAVDPRPTWVRDGSIYTSAGISAGMDLALAWVEEDLGSVAALAVARELVLFLRRPGGQDQVSVSLKMQAAQTKVMQALPVWMMEHLHQPLSVDVLADRAAMSPRNFARVFVREFGTTPARYLSQVRLEAARRLLEETDGPLGSVASASGFRSVDVMRRVFLSALGTTPLRYRGCFRTSTAGLQPPRERRDPLGVARREIARAARVAAGSRRRLVSAAADSGAGWARRGARQSGADGTRSLRVRRGDGVP